MKATLKVKLGDKVFEVGGEGDEKAIIKNLYFWSHIPQKCGNCGKSNIALNFRSPKGNDYYGLKCLDCNADYNFGQYKGGGFFLKSEEKWKVWEGNKTEKHEATPQDEPPSTDVPF